MERTTQMHSQTRMPRLVTGMLVAIAVTLSPWIAFAAPRAVVAPAYGGWRERDMNTHFHVRPGPTPKQIFVTLPNEVTFPGSHQFLLTKGADGAYRAAERARPYVALLFYSASHARLSVHGSGTTASGSWIAVNDFTLIRP